MSGEPPSDLWIQPKTPPLIGDASDRVMHSGTGSQTEFEVGVPFRNANDVKIWVHDGSSWVVQLRYTDFDIVGTTVTFFTGSVPPTGTNNIEFWIQTPRAPTEQRRSWDNPALFGLVEVESQILPDPLQFDARGTGSGQTRRWFEYNRVQTNVRPIPVPTDIMLTDVAALVTHEDSSSPPSTWNVEFYVNSLASAFQTVAVSLSASVGVYSISNVAIDPLIDLSEGDYLGLAFAGAATDFPSCRLLLLYRRRVIHN